MTEPIFEPHFSAVPPLVRKRLEAIAKEVAMRVPDAAPCVGYKMPAFRLKRIFFYFAGFKKHIGVYPPATGPKDFVKNLEPFRGPKGNLIFPHDCELPLEVIGPLAAYMAETYG